MEGPSFLKWRPPFSPEVESARVHLFYVHPHRARTIQSLFYADVKLIIFRPPLHAPILFSVPGLPCFIG